MPKLTPKVWARFKQFPRSFRVFAYLLLSYFGYALILGVITPLILQSQMPKRLTELLGRNVQIAQISINPFLLRTRIENFHILSADQQGDFAGIEKLELELSFWSSLLHLTPTIDHLYVEHPQIKIVRLKSSQPSGQTRFNFSDILDHLAARQTETNSQPTDSPDLVIPGLRSRDIHLSQGAFQFDDQMTGARLHYRGLDFSLQQLDTLAYTLRLPDATSDQNETLQPQRNQYTIQLTGEDQGQLQFDGQFQLQPLDVRGNLSLKAITLPPFWPFAASMVSAQLTDGNINFHSAYRLWQTQDQLNYATKNGQFTLNQLAFQDSKTPKLKLSRFLLDNIALNSTNQQVNIGQLQINGLWADAILNRQGLDLQQLFTPAETLSPEGKTASTENQLTNYPLQPQLKKKVSTNQTSAKQETTPQSSWLVRLHQLKMTETDLNLTEQQLTPGVHWRVSPLSFSTGEILSDLSQPIDYQLAFDISSSTRSQPQKSRGHFTTQGNVDAKAQKAVGNIHLKQLDMSQFQPYLTPYVRLELSKGLLSTQGQFSFAQSSGTATYQGKADLTQLLIKDSQNHQPLLKWQSMMIDKLKFDQQARQLTMHEITLNKPYAKVLIAKDRKTNIGDIVVTPEPSAEAAKATTSTKAKTSAKTEKAAATSVQVQADDAKSLQLEIGAIKIKKGSAYFADYSLTPNFSSGIESLEGHISHLSSVPGTKALVDIKGKIDQYAPVTVKGEVNPLVSPPYLDLDLGFHNVELTAVNPYSGTYAGYYIDKGQLSLGLQYQLEKNQLIGKNHIVIDQLQLGKASHSEQALNLPLKLAIALLQDRNGVIDLGLDISGDLDNPSFSFGSIIMTALTNMITKAVTAPFTLLAGLIGSDDELNIVQFDAGLATLNDTEKDRLKKLASALTDRPKLRVSVEGSVSLAQDSQQLKEMKLKQSLLTQSGLPDLPADLSASRFPEKGPLADTLAEMFQTQLHIRPKEERQKVEQLLQSEMLQSKNPDAKLNQKVVTTRLHIGMYNQLRNNQTVTHDELGLLAQSRAMAVKAFLVNETGLAPERIFLLDSKTELNDSESTVTLTLSAD
jgi:hypothetical protein